jgi:uncharacterized protein YbaR (Trm112 family)
MDNMIRRMLDVLVCPFDKESSLELIEFITKKIDKIDGVAMIDPKKQNSKTEAHLKYKYQISDSDSIPVPNPINEIGENKSDNTSNDRSKYDVVIEEGLLFCNKCLRFYPIVEEIPIILPDELRDKEKDLLLLKKWSKILPDKIVKDALPWHL